MKKVIEGLKNSKFFYSFIGLLLLVVVASVMSPTFRTFNNFITILRQASVLLILSSGLTVVLLTGGMDLSVGATAGFIGCICARLIKTGLPVPICFLIGLCIGAIVGLVNGSLAGILPSFIATYGTNWVMSGLAIIVMQGSIIYDLPPSFTNIAVGYIGPIPNLVIIAALVVAVLYFILSKTIFGRQVYIFGANAECARYSAIPVKRVQLSSFMICSVCAALAGMMMCARLNAADASMGDAYGLQTVASVVVGGTSMLGGSGGIQGTVIGALILTIIINIMNLLGVNSNAQPMVVGIVIIAMVVFDTYTKSRQERNA